MRFSFYFGYHSMCSITVYKLNCCVFVCVCVRVGYNIASMHIKVDIDCLVPMFILLLFIHPNHISAGRISDVFFCLIHSTNIYNSRRHFVLFFFMFLYRYLLPLLLFQLLLFLFKHVNEVYFSLF